MKKKMIIVVFVAAFALTATAAFAGFHVQKPQFPTNNNTCCVNHDPCCPEVTVDTFNKAMITNSVVAISNTGANAIKDKDMHMQSFGFYPMSSGGADIDTGDATSINDVQSSAATEVTVNAPDSGKLSVKTTSMPYIQNKVGAISNTGLNYISKSGNIDTGDAGSQNGVLSVADTTVTIK